MGQYATIILIGAFLTGSLLLFGMQRDTQDADEDLYEHHNKLFARAAARTGLHLAVRKLADDDAMGSWDDDPSDYEILPKTAYEGSAYTVEAFPDGASGDTTVLVARGYAEPAEHTIFARYARAKSDEFLPPAFRNAITSDFYMQYKGNMKILAIEDSINASIHTNDDLTIKGNSFLVEGYGTYTGTVNINPSAADNFDPNRDYNGSDPNYFYADSVHIPRIDISKLRAEALKSGTRIFNAGGPPVEIDGDATGVLDFTDPTSSFWTSTGYTYNCNYANCGTKEHPFVMVVEGALNFLNTVRVIGYGTIVAVDNVTIAPTGSGGGVYGDLTDKNKTKVLLATLSNIDIGKAGGNACLGLGPESTHCYSSDHTAGISLYAEGAVNFKGTPYVVGGVVADEASFDGGGNPTIVYASASKSTLDAGFDYILPIGPILIAYSEW